MNLVLNGLSKGIKSKTRYELSELAANKISRPKIAFFTREKLKNRESWKDLHLQQLCNVCLYCNIYHYYI